MKVFIEENAWASCSYDLRGSPQQLVKLSDRRVVGYVGQDRLLTIDDRSTKEKFLCKLVAKQWGGLLALVGGIGVGIALFFAGPVGWVALAAIAVVAVSAAGAAIAVYNHDCSDPLKSGKWDLVHASVLIQGKNAVLYNQSQLLCGNGGILVASETQGAAQELSDAMKFNARREVAVQILSNAVIGGITGWGVNDRGLDGKIKDTDLATIPLAIASYIHTDFVHTEYKPEQSFAAGLMYSGIGYGLGEMNRVPGLKWTKGKGRWGWGTEVTSLSDWAVTWSVAFIGLGADSLEKYLADLNEGIINNAANRSSAASGKTIICLKH